MEPEVLPIPKKDKRVYIILVSSNKGAPFIATCFIHSLRSVNACLKAAYTLITRIKLKSRALN